MKDEEMAEEYAEDFVKDKYGGNRHCAEVQKEKLFLKIGFQDGLKAGRPQWHDLRKGPNDLPQKVEDERQISDTVWIHIDNWGTEEGYYDYLSKSWIVRCRQVNLPVIAWCEIPTFDKE